jgi:hypothetical protein
MLEIGQMRIYTVLIILLLASFSSFSNEKEIQKTSEKIDFKIIFKNNIQFPNNDYNKDSLNITGRQLYAVQTFTKEQLYKTGLNLFIFGLTCGFISGTFAGTAVIFTYVLSTVINETFQATFLSLLTPANLVYQISYFASLAAASWVLGIVFACLFICLIPGVILMAVNYEGKKNISLLNDAVGFSIHI